MKHLVHLDYITAKTVCQEGDVHVRAHLESFLRESVLFVLGSVFFIQLKEVCRAFADRPLKSIRLLGKEICILPAFAKRVFSCIKRI